MRYTPVEDTGLTLLFGFCDNCKVVICLRILKDKEKFAVDFVPKEKRYHYDTNKSWNNDTNN